MGKGKLIFALMAAVLLLSCKREYCVLRVKIVCSDPLLFNSLQTVVLTNKASDLGGSRKRNWYDEIFGPGTVYKREVFKNLHQYFYVDW
jgi:hypothetical protein